MLAGWLLWPTPALGAALDEEALLRAIAEKESGGNPLAIGRLGGERSAYQFTHHTWRLHGLEPFEWATTRPALAHARALRHLAFLRGVLRRRGLPESVRQLAAAWHYGPHSAPFLARSHYAVCVENLYRSECAVGFVTKPETGYKREVAP